MSSELQNTLNDILNDKNTNLKPENLKSGVTCLGITGNAEIPTSIYSVSDYNLVDFTASNIEGARGSIKIFMYKDWLVLSRTKNTKIYIYYKGNLLGNYIRTKSNDIFGGFLSVSDDEIIFACNKASIYTTSFEGFIANSTTSEITRIEDIDFLYTTANWYSDGATLFLGSSTKVCRYDKDTNSIKYYGSLSGGGDFGYRGVPSISYCNFNKDDTYNTIAKYIYSSESDSYSFIYKQYSNVVGINYYGTKIFRNGNIYELNEDLSIGALLKENAYPHQTGAYGITMNCINDKYYIYPYDSSTTYLYEFDEETNTFNSLTISDSSDKRFSYDGINSLCLYTRYSSDLASVSINISQFNFNSTENLVGVNYNGQTIFFGPDVVFSSDNLLEGTSFIDNNSALISGTMSNNGDVTIAPTTSEQVKEKGYYNSLKVSAVTSAIDSNITPENIKKDISILGVGGTLEGDNINDYIAVPADITTIDIRDCIKKIPLIDTSKVTSMSYMFQDCTALTTIPLLNTSKVTSMNGMFQDCTALTTIPLLNTSAVTIMSSMFQGCTSLTTIPQLDTSKVTSMSNMFSNCTSLTTIPQLDTSKVTNMNNMFYGCTSLTTIPQLDTSAVTSMNTMFRNCTSLTTISLLNTGAVTNMSNMFNNCTSLSNDSLNNILTMLTNATAYTKTKTLKYIGLSETQATTCTTLANWSACETAGWTTGY